MSLIPGKRRLRWLAIIAASNAIVIYTTLYSGWGLLEATFAYLGELVILVLVVCARVVVAKRLPAGMGGRVKTGWPLFAVKLLALAMTLLMYALIVGLIFVLLTFRGSVSDFAGVWDGRVLPEQTLRSLAICWLAFLISHAIAFVSQAREGAFDELLSDERVSALMWRYPPLLISAIAVGGDAPYNAPVVPWFFVGALAFMAIVDTALYLADMDAVNARRKVPIEAV